MRKIILLLLAVSPLAQAADPQCISNCMSQGKRYESCHNACNWRDGIDNDVVFPEPKPRRQVDQFCVQQCTQKGYSYGFCQSRCEY